MVELLAVVIIIVVLLALLIPALDRAIYQAELTKCSVNVGGINQGLAAYALTYQKDYPHRPGVMGGEYWKPGYLHDPDQRPGPDEPPFDDRPALAPFIDINGSLNDPLGTEVDYESSSSTIEVSYHLWAGFKYEGRPGLLRVDDKLTSIIGGQTFRSDVTVSDRDVIGGNFVHGSHPDKAGRMGIEEARDEELPASGSGRDDGEEALAPREVPGKKFTLSRWISYEEGERGAIDMHFARQDGSVERFVAVEPRDERMVPLPESARDDYPDVRTYLPMR